MAKRTKRLATRKAKSKGNRTHSKKLKKPVRRPASPKKAKRKSRPSKDRVAVGTQTRSRQPKQRSTPQVEDTIIDVVDEPIPGVLRVTEIEEITVAVPDSDEADEDE